MADCRIEAAGVVRCEIGNITPGGKDLKYRTKTKQDQQQNLKLKTSMFVYFKSKKLEHINPLPKSHDIVEEKIIG